MALLVVGALLLVLGLFSGATLALVPLGLVPWSADLIMWVLFPVFSIGGYLLFAMGARIGNIRALTNAVSWLLLAMAMLCAVALVLDAAAIIGPVGSLLSLWYVMIVAGVLGAFGAGAHGKSDDIKAAPSTP
ncbi:MAG: hypothetical protein V4463_19865 [Pseudomonadota bacterium]